MACRLLIVVSIRIALVQAQSLDCASVSAPITTMDFYNPSADCRAANPDVEACRTQWSQCSSNAKACSDFNVCLETLIVCLDNIPASQLPLNSTDPCYALNESLTNAKLYLSMGGGYPDSSLQVACQHAACTYAAMAPKLNNGLTCVIPNETCRAASSSPPKFVLTFAGSWDTVLSSKRSAIRGAVHRGIAKLLDVAEYTIRILSIGSGSLVVEFDVLDPTLDGVASGSKLQSAIAMVSFLSTPFAELATESGIMVNLESVTTGEGSGVTLAPTPPVPSPVAGGGPDCHWQGARTIGADTVWSDADGAGPGYYSNHFKSSEFCKFTRICPAGTVIDYTIFGELYFIDDITITTANGATSLKVYQGTFNETVQTSYSELQIFFSSRIPIQFNSKRSPGWTYTERCIPGETLTQPPLGPTATPAPTPLPPPPPPALTPIPFTSGTPAPPAGLQGSGGYLTRSFFWTSAFMAIVILSLSA